MNIREKKSRKRIYSKSVFYDHLLDSTAVTCYYLSTVDRVGSLDFTGASNFFILLDHRFGVLHKKEKCSCLRQTVCHIGSIRLTYAVA